MTFNERHNAVLIWLSAGDIQSAPQKRAPTSYEIVPEQKRSSNAPQHALSACALRRSSRSPARSSIRFNSLSRGHIPGFFRTYTPTTRVITVWMKRWLLKMMEHTPSPAVITNFVTPKDIQ